MGAGMGTFARRDEHASNQRLGDVTSIHMVMVPFCNPCVAACLV